MDAVVVDVGGTTTDVGLLVGGFPRQAGLLAEIGGVQTNYAIPDTVSVGLGGGSLLRTSSNAPEVEEKEVDGDAHEKPPDVVLVAVKEGKGPDVGLDPAHPHHGHGNVGNHGANAKDQLADDLLAAALALLRRERLGVDAKGVGQLKEARRGHVLERVAEKDEQARHGKVGELGLLGKQGMRGVPLRRGGGGVRSRRLMVRSRRYCGRGFDFLFNEKMMKRACSLRLTVSSS